VQLSSFSVFGLFGLYDHTIPFVTDEDSSEASVVIIHGKNGVGKSTVLKMIHGMMKMDFSVFRSVPFTMAVLTFNTGEKLRVRKESSGELRVQFRDHDVLLHSKRSGPLHGEMSEEVESFRGEFGPATAAISFEYLRDARAEIENYGDIDRRYEADVRRLRRRSQENVDEPVNALADKVKEFVRNAQLDSQAFFRSSDPDLFQRIIDELASPMAAEESEIRQQLLQVQELERKQSGFGLRTDTWNHSKLMNILDAHDTRTLTVIGTYAEFLLSRAKDRQFVADRLSDFEDIMNDLFEGKSVKVNDRTGLSITSQLGQKLNESQLSSGEYQLLFVMVSALTTKRRGTVIAIDEPELSMHLEWQRKLVPGLIRCASRAAPQFILATHSPDVAADYRDSLVRIG
jgi:predicted ATPase